MSTDGFLTTAERAAADMQKLITAAHDLGYKTGKATAEERVTEAEALRDVLLIFVQAFCACTEKSVLKDNAVQYLERKGLTGGLTFVASVAPEPSIPSPSGRDRTEDFPHENGYYVNRCVACEKKFMGHKRRATCKECAGPSKETK